MARTKLTDKHVLYIRLAGEMLDSIARDGKVDPSVARDIAALDEDKRKLTLDYAVQAALTERRESLIASLEGHKAKHDAAAKEAKAKAAQKTEALSKLVTHARVKARARRIVKGRGK